MHDVCVDARMLLASGIGTYLRALLPLLAQGPFQFRLIVNKDLVSKLPWLTRFSLEFLEAPIYSPAEQIQLPGVIGHCDLFWSPHYNIPLLNIRARKRLVTIHDINHIVFAKNLTLAQRIYAQIVMRQAIARSAHIITVSEFSKRELCEHVRAPAKKITHIHLGVDKKRFSQDEGRGEEIKKRYRLPEKYFLFVGNLKPHKNFMGLVHAYEHAGEQLRDFPLVVVGRKEGFLEADSDSLRLIKDFAIHQKIYFLDFIAEEDLPVLYRLSAATIFPSLYEGFGLPAVEAMSAGSPLAVSNAASLPEVCGDAAVYFDPRQPEDIARVLVQLATHPHLLETLKKKGLERSQQFCWDKCAQAHIRVMEDLCRL